jgi:hypothetical protein
MTELRSAANTIRASGILQKPCNATTIDNAIRTAAAA